MQHVAKAAKVASFMVPHFPFGKSVLAVTGSMGSARLPNRLARRSAESSPSFEPVPRLAAGKAQALQGWCADEGRDFTVYKWHGRLLVRPAVRTKSRSVDIMR